MYYMQTHQIKECERKRRIGFNIRLTEHSMIVNLDLVTYYDRYFGVMSFRDLCRYFLHMIHLYSKLLTVHHELVAVK